MDSWRVVRQVAGTAQLGAAKSNVGAGGLDVDASFLFGGTTLLCLVFSRRGRVNWRVSTTNWVAHHENGSLLTYFVRFRASTMWMA